MTRSRVARITRDDLVAALMPAAALAVHELRYLLAFGDHASAQLQDSGHGYLEPLLPVVGVGAALVAGRWLVRSTRRGSVRERQPGRLWLWATVALLVLYTGQELTEGVLASGHAGGLAGVFGNGGLWAVPAAVVMGGLVALLLTGATEVERAIAVAGRQLLRIVLPPPPVALWHPRRSRAVARPCRRLAHSRAPPVV